MTEAVKEKNRIAWNQMRRREGGLGRSVVATITLKIRDRPLGRSEAGANEERERW